MSRKTGPNWAISFIGKILQMGYAIGMHMNAVVHKRVEDGLLQIEQTVLKSKIRLHM